jgi:hypothetical protein
MVRARFSSNRALYGMAVGGIGVAPSQFRGVDAHLAGGEVDQSLDLGGLGPSGTAMGLAAVRLGQHAGYRHMQRGRKVDAAHRADVDHGASRRGTTRRRRDCRSCGSSPSASSGVGVGRHTSP